jgi:bifunctional pyridoxal-dependent enzyme with beta-cystathionase and maltose regulon repressor activities
MVLEKWNVRLVIVWDKNMSQAFVKEEDARWLHDVLPTMNALITYLTGENNGVRVYEQKSFFHPKEKREVHQMSNGLLYAKNDEGKWYIV